MDFKKLLVASITVAALTACGGEKTADNKAPTTASPAPSATSSTPAKTAEGKSLSKSTNPKAEVTAGAKFQEVKASDLTQYKYKTGLFSLDIPKEWEPTDNSKAGEAIVLWFDPTKNSLIAVDIFNAPPNLTPDKSTALLQTFLKNTFGSRPDFAMEEPVKQPDNSVQIVWGYTETVKAGNETATGWVQGNSFIETKGDKVSLLTVGVLSKQFNDLKEPLTKVINSYKFTPSVKIE